ncbi:MAG: hypothetical protein KC589_00425, partial [Nanoarchaeota archaeon]|nr:hypothetical protein [Nanoarchaeota archaeon]
NYLNYTWSTISPNITGNGNLSWFLDLNSGDNLSLYVNFTGLLNRNFINNSVYLKNNSGNIIEHSLVFFNISNTSFGNFSLFENISILRSLLNVGNISVGDIVHFQINLSNTGNVNFNDTDYYFRDAFNPFYLIYNSSSLIPNSILSTFIIWKFNLSVSDNLTFNVSYLALNNISNGFINSSFSHNFNFSDLSFFSINYSILPLINASVEDLNISLVKTLLNVGNISVDDVVEFKINISNLDGDNITDTNYYFEDQFDMANLVYLNSNENGFLNSNKVRWNLNISKYENKILYVNFTARYPVINASNSVYLKNLSNNIKESSLVKYSIYGNSYNVTNGIKIETIGFNYPGVNLQNGVAQVIYRISNLNTYNFSSNDFYFRSNFNYYYYNYSWSSINFNETGLNFVKWRFNLTANSTQDLIVNYTLRNTSISVLNGFFFKNNSGGTISMLNLHFEIYNSTIVSNGSPSPVVNPGGGGGGGGGGRSSDDKEEVIEKVNETLDIELNKSNSLSDLFSNKTKSELIDEVNNILDRNNGSLNDENKSFVDEIIDILVEKDDKDKVSEILNINKDEIKEVRIVDKIDESVKVSKIDLENMDTVLVDFNKQVRDSVSKAISRGESIDTKVILNSTVYNIVDSKGRKAEITNVKKKIAVNLKNTTGNLIHIIEIIPKEVAYSAYLIIGDFEILEDDPVLLFTFPIEEANDGFVDIEYSVSGNVINELEQISTAAVVNNEMIIPERDKNLSNIVFIFIFIFIVICAIAGYWYYDNNYRKKRGKIDFNEFDF